MPTASSVVSDLIEVARGFGVRQHHYTPSLGFTNFSEEARCDAANSVSSFYLRMTLADELGALASISTTLAECGISVEALLQKEPRLEGGEARATLIILTHEVAKGSINQALKKLNHMAVIKSEVMVMRMEHFD